MSKHGNGKKGRKSQSLFPLGCVCKDMRSVSVCVPSTTDVISKSSFRKSNSNISSMGFSSLPSTSISSSETVEIERQEISVPSFSSLLRELNELEQNVKELGKKKNHAPPPLHAFNSSDKSNERTGAPGILEESIVIVKDSEEPLEDFKKSMLQMIVENQIASKDELEELLQRFLVLNSLENHDIIVQAFTELWEELLSDVEATPKPAPRRATHHSLKHL